jgi:sugar O-acyltransferase (sialic acid O-acetyltransferase NeuD family)
VTRLVGVYGASGFGREVLPLVRAAAGEDRIVFVDDGVAGTRLNGVDVLDWNSFLQESGDKAVAVAIADSAVRESLTNRCAEAGVALAEVRARDAVVMDDVRIGEGAILSCHVTITSNVRIGRAFHANIYSYVAHDCVIGDFVTFAPRVSCNGNVHVEDHAYVGTGAILRQGAPDKPLVIGRGAIIGMGAVVTKDVAPGITVVGNPARPLVRD